MTGLVDVHSHVHGPDFETDRADVLSQAGDAGVELVLAMGEGPEDNLRVLRVADSHPSVVPCLGLHPDRAGEDPVEAVVAQIRQHAGRIAAIGEVGLDFWVAKDPPQRERQRVAFSTLVTLAAELDLPLSVHSRSAGHHSIDLLASLGAGRVCMHAFDGSAKHAARGAELGYLFSVPPSVIRSPQKQKMVRRLPLDALMLETDSPVLGPEPGQRNVPANVTVAAAQIAELKGCTLETVHRVSSENAWRLFRLERFSRAGLSGNIGGSSG